MKTLVKAGRVETRLGEVAYVRAGRGSALVLLHGNGHSWHEFAPALDALAAQFDVVAWDMPGHGDSADVTPPPSIEAYAGVLADLVAALGLRRPAVLGSSIGAFIAARYAAEGGEVCAVVLDEMQFRPRDWWLAAWPRVETMFGQTTQSLEAVQPRFKRQVDADLLDRWNQERTRTGAAAMIGVMAAIRDFDLSATLARLAAPCLLLFGADGPAVERSEALAAAVPGASMTIVPGAGHFISIDQPAAFAAAVSQFLQGKEDTLDHPSGPRVRIDRGRCVCSESCVGLAPFTFETDEEGLVRLISGGSDPESAVRSAAANCPVGAISLEIPGNSS